MAIGPGKYDHIVTELRVMLDVAETGGIALLVVGGNHGNGFAVQGAPQLQVELPRMLREMADEIEDSLKELLTLLSSDNPEDVAQARAAIRPYKEATSESSA